MEIRWDGISPKPHSDRRQAESILFVLGQLPTAAQRIAARERDRQAAIDKVIVSIPTDLRPDNDH